MTPHIVVQVREHEENKSRNTHNTIKTLGARREQFVQSRQFSLHCKNMRTAFGLINKIDQFAFPKLLTFMATLYFLKNVNDFWVTGT